MHRQKYIFIGLLLSFLLSGGFFFATPRAQAQSDVMLSANPIAQRFSPADPSGDTGFANCMPAALTVALKTLADEGHLVMPADKLSYANVRSVVRAFMPDPTRGIAPKFLVAATPILTDNAFQLEFLAVDPASWQEFLATELKKGYPVIVHVSDRNSLYNPASQSSWSHVVVVYGMDDSSIYYTDSWDGQTHTISREQFAYAWGKGHYQWLAFRFQEEQQLTTFRDILKYRFRVAS